MNGHHLVFVLAVVASTIGSAAVSTEPRPSTAPAREPRRDAGPPALSTARKAQLAESYGKLPLTFTANRGQTDGRVRFLSRGPGYSLFLGSSEAVLNLDGGSKGRAAVLRLKLVGSNTASEK